MFGMFLWGWTLTFTTRSFVIALPTKAGDILARTPQRPLRAPQPAQRLRALPEGAVQTGKVSYFNAVLKNIDRPEWVLQVLHAWCCNCGVDLFISASSKRSIHTIRAQCDCGRMSLWLFSRRSLSEDNWSIVGLQVLLKDLERRW